MDKKGQATMAGCLKDPGLLEISYSEVVEVERAVDERWVDLWIWIAILRSKELTSARMSFAVNQPPCVE
jgi:hypothetical protein